VVVSSSIRLSFIKLPSNTYSFFIAYESKKDKPVPNLKNAGECHCAGHKLCSLLQAPSLVFSSFDTVTTSFSL